MLSITEDEPIQNWNLNLNFIGEWPKEVSVLTIKKYGVLYAKK